MKNQTKRMKRRKRHFQLLELMVAIFILLICLSPAMRIFTTMYTSSQGMAKANMRDHLAHVAHALVVEKLYKQEIPLNLEDESMILLSDSSFNEEIKKNSLHFKGKLSIADQRGKRNSEHPSKILAKLDIQFEDARPTSSSTNKEKEGDVNYDYLIYINCEEIGTPGEDAGLDESSSQELAGQSSLEGDDDDDDDDDDDGEDGDEEEDDD